MMKISTKGRYGVRFMMDLAINGTDTKVTLKDVANRQDISEKYLWQVVTPLKSAGLISSVPGPGGGYALTREPAAITLREILAALEGKSGLVDCVITPSLCLRGNACPARAVWQDVAARINRILDSYSLSEMAEKKVDLRKDVVLNYAI